jgi:hypothetical protein
MSSILSYISEWKIPTSPKDIELIEKLLSTYSLNSPSFISISQRSPSIQIIWYDRTDLVSIDHEYWGKIEVLREYLVCEINRLTEKITWRYTNRSEDISLVIEGPGDERANHLALASH